MATRKKQQPESEEALLSTVPDGVVHRLCLRCGNERQWRPVTPVEDGLFDICCEGCKTVITVREGQI